LIPKFLRAPNGELLFPTLKDQQLFTDLLYSDAELLTLVTQKYIELTKKIADIEEQAKNALTASPNGS